MKKSIKKISSIALSLVMVIASMPMALAEDTTIDQDSAEKIANVPITYEMGESYTISFPASVAIDHSFDHTSEGKIEIKAANVAVRANNSIQIKVGSGSDNAIIPLRNEEDGAEISLIMGLYGTEYTPEAPEVIGTAGSDIDEEKIVLEVGYKFKNGEDELKGKPAGSYRGNIVIKTEVVPNV